MAILNRESNSKSRGSERVRRKVEAASPKIAGDPTAAHVRQRHSGKENSWLKRYLIYNNVS
jgi:hypothetical protein